MKKRLLSLLLTVTMIVGVVSMLETGVEAATELKDYPYANILKYSTLDSTFESLAKDYILPEYQDYVLNAIKYHIESRYAGNSDVWRVANNLMGAYGSVDGNLIFVFDGVSKNLSGVTKWEQTGYVRSNGTTSQLSAVCVVVRLNSKGMPEVAFASQNASTFADQVRGNNKNDGLDHLTTFDGVYNMMAVNHKGKKNPAYAALNVQGANGVRFGTNSSAIDTSSDINFHYSYGGTTTSSTGNSTGCFTLGKNESEYNNFINAMTGFSNAISSGTYNIFSTSKTTSPSLNYEGKFKYKLNDIVGIMILDRSNYSKGIQKMFGSDKDRTANQIFSEITATSQVWHDAILERMNEEDIKVSKITVSSDGSTSTVSIWDTMIVNGYYYGTGEKSISKDSNATVKWTKNADSYDVWAAVIDGAPDPGNDVSIARLDEDTGWISTTKNSITLSSSILKNHGGKWVKVAISAKEDDGTISRMSCFYFLISGVDSAHIRGDANGYGVKNTSDFTYALIHSVTNGVVNKNVTESLDYNGDGKVTTADATYLLINIVTNGLVNSNLH